MSNIGTKPVRSPSYPNMPLADAIAAVRKIEEQYRSAPVERADGAKILGYSSLSGPANKSLAALAHYGLVERAGKGHMKVTERARAILHSESDEEKQKNLRWAALEPNLFRDLQERFPDMTPPEEGVVTFLNRQGFNKNAIRPAAKAYLETLSFLEQMGVSESHGNDADEGADDGESKGSDTTFGNAKIGDLIDYESGGAVANPSPLKVRAVSEDGKWVFVEGSETGLEMNQVIVTSRDKGETEVPRPTLPLAPNTQEEKIPSGTRKAMFPLDEGDVTLLFPDDLSAEGLDLLGSYLDIFLNREKNKKARAG